MNITLSVGSLAPKDMQARSVAVHTLPPTTVAYGVIIRFDACKRAFRRAQPLRNLNMSRRHGAEYFTASSRNIQARAE